MICCFHKGGKQFGLGVRFFSCIRRDFLGTRIKIFNEHLDVDRDNHYDHFQFLFIIKACDLLPSGTVYAVFTGSGAAAIAMIDFTLLGEEFTFGKAFFIGLIIIGVVGIQLTTPSKESGKVARKEGS